MEKKALKMLSPEARRELYRVYGLTRGLSDEDADDFAQEAFVRFLVSNDEAELKMSFVFADFMRRERGRLGTPRNRARVISLDQPIFNDPECVDLMHDVVPSMPRWELQYDLGWLEDEATLRGYKRKHWVTKLSNIIGTAVDELAGMLKARIYMIARRKNGLYYVVSQRTGKRYAGPFECREDAEQNLVRVEKKDRPRK
jgi:hypothetical protein